MHGGGRCAMIVPMVTRHRDSLLARGNTSDVFGWSRHAVVKVLRPGIPDAWAAREAHTTELVHAAGLPAPAILDLTTVGGRPAIVFERVVGTSMWDQMLADPRDIPRLARLLAELQAEVNATAAPPGLPGLIDRLRDNIARASFLAPEERLVARTALERHPHEAFLCHFDVHPNNVLMGERGPTIIDWFDAAAGSPAADVVRSSVLMREDAADGHLPCADAAIIERVHSRYLEAVVRVRNVGAEELVSWEPTVLAARLAEPIPDTILRATHRTWRGLVASQPSRLAAGLRSPSAAPQPADRRKSSLAT